jgi:hypothetical protein
MGGSLPGCCHSRMVHDGLDLTPSYGGDDVSSPLPSCQATLLGSIWVRG